MKTLLCLVLLLVIKTASINAQVRSAGHAGKAKHSGVQYGTASFYNNKFQGRVTASGIPYDKNKMTCAHNSLPFGTWINVTNISNKRSVVVKVTDRLHHSNNRLIDLSGIAALKLGYIKKGLARVKVEILKKKSARAKG